MIERIQTYDLGEPIPKGAVILRAELALGQVRIAAIIRDGAPLVPRRFFLHADGDAFTGEEGEYVGYVDGFHIFEHWRDSKRLREEAHTAIGHVFQRDGLADRDAQAAFEELDAEPEPVKRHSSDEIVQRLKAQGEER